MMADVPVNIARVMIGIFGSVLFLGLRFNISCCFGKFFSVFFQIRQIRGGLYWKVIKLW
jgi:hypothetical protein